MAGTFSRSVMQVMQWVLALRVGWWILMSGLLLAGDGVCEGVSLANASGFQGTHRERGCGILYQMTIMLSIVYYQYFRICSTIQ
jgi:hypothetical protein